MKNYIIYAVIVVVSVAFSWLLISPVQNVVNQTLGALSSPDIQSPYLSWGGVRDWRANSALRSATSTLCAIQTPAASSTLVSATVRVDFATTSATYLEIGSATTAFATTTGLGILSIAANGSGTLIASSTGVGTLYQSELAPSTWINVKASFATAASAATVPQGRCQAVFREI